REGRRLSGCFRMQFVIGSENLIDVHGFPEVMIRAQFQRLHGGGDAAIPVKMNSVIVESRLLIRSMRSSPLVSGIRKSSRTRSGLTFPASSSVSSALPAA